MNCISPNNKTNDCKSNQEVDTIAKFQCKPYYVPYDSLEVSNALNEIQCGHDGNWIGKNNLEQFACREGNIIQLLLISKINPFVNHCKKIVYSECGKRLGNPKPQIVHGKPTNQTFWPWHATLFSAINNYWHFICGGSIIRSSVIVTAAHCVAPGNRKGNETLYTIVVGAINSNFTENQVAANVEYGIQFFNVS